MYNKLINVVLAVLLAAASPIIARAQEADLDTIINQTLDRVESFNQQIDQDFESMDLEPAPVPSGDTQDISAVNKKVSLILDDLEVKDMDVKEVLDLISMKTGVEIIRPSNISGTVTIYLRDVDVRDALRIILETNDLAYEEEKSGDDVIFRVLSAQEYTAKHGLPFGQRIQTKIVPLLYSDPTDIMEILDQMKSSAGKIIHNEQNNTLVLMDAPEKIGPMEELIKELDVPIETEVFHLENAKAEKIAGDIEKVLTKSIGRVQFDSRSNNVVITDTHLKIGKISELIKQLDKLDKQILLKTQTIQITLNVENLVGVDWEAIVSNFQKILFANARLKQLNEANEHLSVGTISKDDLAVLLEALETVGDSMTISQSEVNIDNKDQAKLLLISEALNQETNGELNKDLFLDEEKIRIDLVPEIVDEKTIDFKLKPEFTAQNDPVHIEAATAEQEAQDETKKDYLQVKLDNGSTIVIGGLFNTIVVESTRKIPLLGDIPFLGIAFRNQGQQRVKTELITFITAEIIDKK